MRENLSLVFTNSKGADQPAHLHSLTSIFVIRLLESITTKISVAGETGLCLALSKTPKTGFVVTLPME